MSEHANPIDKSAAVEAAVREFHDLLSALDKKMDAMQSLVGMDQEGDFAASVWWGVGFSIGALNVAYGIGDWLEWWWHECQLGAKPMQAGLPGEPLRTIATIDDLVRLILDDLASG